MSEFGIYVACLASYNNGVLHGAWIDVEGKEADDIHAEVAAMLRKSPYPNVTVPDYEAAALGAGWTRNEHNGYFVGPIGSETRMADYDDWQELCEQEGIEPLQVPSAEEWAIHEHEGFGDLIGEYTSFDDVAAIAEVLGDDNEDKRRGLIWLIKDRGYSLSDALDKCEDVRTFDGTATEYAESFVDDCYSEKELGPLAAYIDYEHYARDLELGGEIDSVEIDGERFIVTNAAEF